MAYDYGMKYNILRRLRQHGFKVQVVPATATAAEALAYKPANFVADGRYRTIEILTQEKGLKVRPRKGYYAPRQ